MAHRSETDPPSENRIDDVLTYLGNRYEFVLLPILMAFMFVTRYLSRDNFTTADGFYLGGIDSYYHWRTTLYTIEHWPNTMPFDPWTEFPDGNQVGHFGTGFDQLIATLAIIVGLGNPSEALVHEVVLFAIPFLGALVAIPVYLIGKRLGGRIGGIGAVVLLALSPGSFFSRSTVGQHQHHVAEVLFMAIAVLAFMVALRVAEREKPVFELILDRDLDGLRSTIGYSTLAGVALAGYMWMWPPGITLVGILGVFFVVYLSIEYAAGRSPEHLAFVGAIAFAVTGVLMLGMMEVWSTGPTSYGYIAPVLSFIVSIGSIFMAYVAREWERKELDRLLYPVGIGLSVVIAMGILWLVLPDVFNRLVGEATRRILPIGPAETDLTIQEANPPGDYSAQAFHEFGLAFYTAIIGLIGIILAPFLGQRARAEHGLIVVWSLFLISMSMTQIRFWYYLILPVVVLNAYLIGYVVEWADLKHGIQSLREIEGYQVLVLATVLMILVVPLMPPVASASVIDVGSHQGPHPDTFKWDESLDYLETNTPEVGDWAGAGNQFDYYGTYPVPEGSHDYPEGSYGVMSWWDYGHLITVNGERIPHANPFQSGADSASQFLLAESEDHRTAILDGISTDEDLGQDPDALIAAMENYDEDEIDDFRYVMIDDSMATGKFGAITEWSGPAYSEYVATEEVEIADNETVPLQVMNDRFYETTVGHFYFDDAYDAEQYRLVHESSRSTTIVSVAQQTEQGAWETVILNQRLDAMDPRTIQAIQFQPQLQMYDIKQQPAVKTFERVEGATLTAETEAAPGSDVSVSLRLNTSERTFNYVQQATVDDDGTFTVTVPYATSEDVGPEDGYTASEVHAEGVYHISVTEGNDTVERGTASVPEMAIYDGDDIDVELDEVEDDENGDEETENGDSDGEETNGDEETENGETDEEENGTDDENGDADGETNDEEDNETVDDGAEDNESTEDNETNTSESVPLLVRE